MNRRRRPHINTREISRVYRAAYLNPIRCMEDPQCVVAQHHVAFISTLCWQCIDLMDWQIFIQHVQTVDSPRVEICLIFKAYCLGNNVAAWLANTISLGVSLAITRKATTR